MINWLCLIVFSVFALADEAPNPKEVYIESFSHNGSGCPIGSTASVLSGDAKALTVLFDRFSASTESGSRRDFKACSLDVKLHVPSGWSFALFQTQVRGFANIASTSIGTQRSRYTFGGQRLAVLAKQIPGPFADDYIHEETAPISSLVYSPCGGERSLGVLTSLELDGPNSLMTVDSTNGELVQKYQMNWKRCTGAESIGPVNFTPNFSQVRVLDGDTGKDVARIQAYAPEVRGGMHVAACDLNGDGVSDVVTGTGKGAPPHVRAFDGNNGQALNHPLSSFFAYATSFIGGVNVGCGDIDGDGRQDLITGAGPGAGSHVIVWSGRTGAAIRSFFAYPNFTGGVTVASTDLNRDGAADIITGTGAGGGPHVKVFDGRTGNEIRSFFAFEPSFSGGVKVAGGDLNQDGFGDIIVGAGPGGGPHVTAFSGATQQILQSFFAYDVKFTGGVTVAVADMDGDGVNDIVTAAGKGGGPHIKVINGMTGLSLEGWNGSFWAFTPTFRYGVEVAAGSPRRFFLVPASGSAYR